MLQYCVTLLESSCGGSAPTTNVWKGVLLEEDNDLDAAMGERRNQIPFQKDNLSDIDEDTFDPIRSPWSFCSESVGLKVGYGMCDVVCRAMILISLK